MVSTRLIRYANKRLACSQQLCDGVPHGRTREFSVDGRITREAHYREGKLHGHEQVYNEEGVLIELNSYTNGVRTGLSKKQIINAFAYLSRRGVDVQAEPTVYYIGRPKRGLFERILKGRWK